MNCRYRFPFPSQLPFLYVTVWEGIKVGISTLLTPARLFKHPHDTGGLI